MAVGWGRGMCEVWGSEELFAQIAIYTKHNLSRKTFIPSLCPGLPAGFPA